MKAMEKLTEAENYYDKFSRFYDILSPDWYYRKPRKFAIEALQLHEGQTILNLPCGTGQNFEYFQQYLKGSGKVVGIDLSEGMLDKARQKVAKNNWSNVELIKCNSTDEHLEGTCIVSIKFIFVAMSAYTNHKHPLKPLPQLLQQKSQSLMPNWKPLWKRADKK